MFAARVIGLKFKMIRAELCPALRFESAASSGTFSPEVRSSNSESELLLRLFAECSCTRHNAVDKLCGQKNQEVTVFRFEKTASQTASRLDRPEPKSCRQPGSCHKLYVTI